MFRRRTFRQTTLLTILCISILAGLALARRVPFSQPLMLVPIGIATGFLFRKKNVLVLCLVVLCGLGLGLWRGTQYVHYEQAYQRMLKKQVVMTVRAETDAVYSKTRQLEFDATGVSIESPYAQKLPGKIKLEGSGVPMVYRGDILRVEGSLSRTRGLNRARMSFARLSLVEHGGTPVDQLRRKFMASLQSTLPEPHASFGGGLLIGQRATIPDHTNEELSLTGLTHIVAVSGANLTIIIVAMRRLMGKRSKFQSTFAAAGLLIVFLLLTGMSASIVRAALVSALSLFAWYYGRTFKPLLLIGAAAALTAWWNPFYLWSDLAWYLSFVSFFGVLMLAPLATKIVSKRDEPKLLAALLTETIAAQIMTLPLIMYVFGRISNIGLLANVLVVPLVPIAMLLTLIAGVAGMIVTPIAGWFAWPARIILLYMLDMAAVLSKVPHAASEQYISVWAMIGLYMAIVVVLLLLWLKVRRQKVQNLLE